MNPPPASRTRLLLIDDDPALCTLLREALEAEGYEVETATNGRVALELHQQRPAAVVICDLLMPEKDGLEVLLEFRRSRSPVKCIAISGGGLARAELYLKIAASLGAARILIKPFGIEQLLQAVADVLPQR